MFPTQTYSNGPGPRGSPLYSGQYPSGISYLPPLQRPTLLPHSRVGSRARRPKGRCKHPLIGALPLMRICQSTSKTRQDKTTMKVVVGLCAVLPFRGRPLLTGPWLLNLILHWQHSLHGTRQKWTDLSHHAQLSMCTSRDKMAASGMEFSVLIECEFVAVGSWKVGWWWFFLHKICTRPIGRLVSQFYSSSGCFYPSWTTGRVVSSNTVQGSGTFCW